MQLEIKTSGRRLRVPAIDTSGQFFFGTDDGCAGYYSQEPSQ